MKKLAPTNYIARVGINSVPFDIFVDPDSDGCSYVIPLDGSTEAGSICVGAKVSSARDLLSGTIHEFLEVAFHLNGLAFKPLWRYEEAPHIRQFMMNHEQYQEAVAAASSAIAVVLPSIFSKAKQFTRSRKKAACRRTQ